MTATAAAKPRLVETAAEILQGIHQHRLLSTGQVHALHAPHAHISWPQRLLAQLRDLGLVHMTRLSRRPALWHLTDPGADAVEVIGDRIETRRKVLAPDAAVGALERHTSPSTMSGSRSCRLRASAATSADRSPGGTRSPTSSARHRDAAAPSS